MTKKKPIFTPLSEFSISEMTIKKESFSDRVNSATFKMDTQVEEQEKCNPLACYEQEDELTPTPQIRRSSPPTGTTGPGQLGITITDYHTADVPWQTLKKKTFSTNPEIIKKSASHAVSGQKKIKDYLIPDRDEEFPVSHVFIPEQKHELNPAPNPSHKEDFVEVKESFLITRTNETTIVSIIVVNKKEPEKNQINAIKCCGGVAIGGYAYDRNRDACIIQCISYYDLGAVPVSFSITMKNVGEWDVKIPVPVSVLEKYFTAKQRSLVENVRKNYSEQDYDIQFIQMTGCY